MKKYVSSMFVLIACALVTSAFTQEQEKPEAKKQPSPGVLSVAELKRVVPAAYFFAGQTAPVQMRNAAGIRLDGGKLVLAALMDTSGYSTAIAEKYQGLLISQSKLNVEGSELPVGAYGFGFIGGKFIVMDVAADEVLNVPHKSEEKLARPVPLKIVQEGDEYRLHAGKKWVSLKAQ